MISAIVVGAAPGALRGSALLTAVGRQANIAHLRACRSGEWLNAATAHSAGSHRSADWHEPPGRVQLERLERPQANEAVEGHDQMKDVRWLRGHE
jgi:hypothetical protein